MTIQQLLHYAKEQLKPITDVPLLEAEILLAHVLQKTRSDIYIRQDQIITNVELERFNHYLERRCQKEPIAYLTGSREFWSLELHVNQDTLIPRPETELLIESILKLFPHHEEKIKLADLGTGSGAIALALGFERPTWEIHATDISENALLIARHNAQRLSIKNIFFSQGDWCKPLPLSYFDIIVSNPPYIAEAEWDHYKAGLAFEPRAALTSGIEGLDAIRTISQEAMHYLKPGGYLMIEHGFSQAGAVRQILAKEGYGAILSLHDLLGHERATVCRLLV